MAQSAAKKKGQFCFVSAKMSNFQSLLSVIKENVINTKSNAILVISELEKFRDVFVSW